jgi:hypothetical protein
MRAAKNPRGTQKVQFASKRSEGIVGRGGRYASMGKGMKTKKKQTFS